MARDYTTLVPLTIRGFVAIAKGTFLFTLALAVGIFITNELWVLYLSNSEPVKFHAMIIDPDVVAPGDPLFVTADLTRFRYCFSERDEFVADVATNTNQWSARFSNGSTELGRVKIRNRYAIPVLPPGAYVLRMIAFYKCSTGDAHTIRAPEALFVVR